MRISDWSSDVCSSDLVLMYIAHLINHRYYSRIAQVLLYVSIPLLLYTLFFGSSINQASRWIMIPVINETFQTSDLAKLALYMFLAREQIGRASCRERVCQYVLF